MQVPIPRREPVSRVRHGRHHVGQGEVGFERRIVHRIACLAHLLGPVAPIPGLQLRSLSSSGHGLLQQGPLAGHGRHGTAPYIVQQAPHPLAGLGHGVGQLEVGIAGMAHQRGLPLAHGQDAAGNGSVVMGSGLLTASGPSPPGLLSQIAPR